MLQNPTCNCYKTNFLSVPWGSYFDYVFEWNKHADDENVMTITYEELKAVRNTRGCPVHCFVRCKVGHQDAGLLPYVHPEASGGLL